MIYYISILLALAAAAIEAISYAGFIQSHLHISAYFFYLLSILLALKSRKSFAKSKWLYILGIVPTFTYMVLVFLEKINYPNFIYTIAHINLFNLLLFTALLWFHLLIIKQFGFIKSLLIATLIFVAVDGTGRTLAIIYIGLRDLALDPFATYSQKMTNAYPGVYPALQQVRQLTSEDATILIPPQGNPWEIEGNAAMVTYFLYPRHVKNLDVDKLKDLPNHTYLLIAKGSWPKTGDTDYGWPKVAVHASTLWQIDLSSQQNLSYARDYDPLLDKWDWGLIEVKHE